MFNYKICRNLDNFYSIIEIENISFLIGSLFDECTLVKSYNKFTKYTENTQVELENYIRKIINLEDYLFQDENIIDEISKIDFILITSMSEILSWPYFLKISKNFKGKIFATEPIIQISKYYLKEFYKIFNSIFSKLVKFTRSKSSEYMIDESPVEFQYVTEIDINLFVESIHKITFNQKIPILNHLIFEAISSEYNLGSCSYLFTYFNKYICILKNFSSYDYRYPKEMEFHRVVDHIDYLIQIPSKTNELDSNQNEIEFNNLDYSNEITKLFEMIYKIISKNELKSMIYQTIMIAADSLFLLEIVDFLIYKLPKEVKILYFSESIKPVIEYANVSHSYIKNKYHNKIFDYEYPFQFDKLFPKNEINLLNNFLENKKNSDSLFFSNNSLYLFNDLDSYLKPSSFTNISNKEYPIIYIVDAFSMFYGDSRLIYDTFNQNATNSDAIIFSKPYYFIDQNKSNAKAHIFNIDYNYRISDLKKLLEGLKCLNYCFYTEYDNNILFSKHIINNDLLSDTIKIKYVLNEKNTVFFKDLNYNQVFLVSDTRDKKDTKSMNFKQENGRIYVSLNSLNESDLDKLCTKAEFDPSNTIQLENELNEYLKFNEMSLSNIEIQNNYLKMVIKNSKSLIESASILIKYSTMNNLPDIEINTVEIEDTIFLNNLISCLLLN